jgi:hypothetical protein
MKRGFFVLWNVGIFAVSIEGEGSAFTGYFKLNIFG